MIRAVAAGLPAAIFTLPAAAQSPAIKTLHDRARPGAGRRS